MKTKRTSCRRRWGILALALGTLLGLRLAAAQESRWPGNGHARDILREFDGKAVGGVSYVPAMVGDGFRFDGRDGAISIPDVEALRITGSLTLRAWVRVASYPPKGQDWGPIVFRGDDRGGRDPYFLSVDPDGDLVFAVDSGASMGIVRAPIPLHQF